MEPYDLIPLYYQGDEMRHKVDKKIKSKASGMVRKLYEKGYLTRHPPISVLGDNYWKITVTPDYGPKGCGEPQSLEVPTDSIELPDYPPMPLEFSMKLGRRSGFPEVDERWGTSTILKFSIDIAGYSKPRFWKYRLVE